MADILRGAVGLGQAAFRPTGHDAETTYSLKKRKLNNAALRTLSRFVRDASNLTLSLWDGLTLEERERRRIVEERKTVLIYHMKNVRIPFLLPRFSCRASQGIATTRDYLLRCSCHRLNLTSYRIWVVARTPLRHRLPPCCTMLPCIWFLQWDG
jgi:hypothetical protein